MPNQAIKLTPKDVLRFESRFTKSGGCWNWTACCNEDGYGQFRLARRTEIAHRVAYALYVGPIPPGLFVLHKCDNPGCMNPEHLWLGTNADNMADMVAKGRARSKYGEENGRAKLNLRDVLKIRELAHQAGYTQRSLARQFGVCHASIYYIVNGKSWVRATHHQEVQP